MKFLIFVIDNLTSSATEAEMKAIDIFNEQLRKDGHWITAGGLDSPNNAAIIDNRNDANIFTSQPLFDAQENFSGFWLIEAPSIEIARKLAAQGSKSCNRKVELRPLLG
ncbi:MAG: hypothetical protein RIS18_1240 [Actinomycetota bacterium]|jgi:hypothetical protein